MDKDATPSFVGYCVQEVLVARYFAFLHVLTIFFGTCTWTPAAG